MLRSACGSKRVSKHGPAPTLRDARLRRAPQDEGGERPHYSGLAPERRTTSDHLVSSRSMSAAYSSGVDGSGSVPSLAMRSLVSGALTASRSAAESLLMIGRGVPAGATIP